MDIRPFSADQKLETEVAGKESDPNSLLIKEDKNCNNSYIESASGRNKFSIQETENEKMSAINIKIALWS